MRILNPLTLLHSAAPLLSSAVYFHISTFMLFVFFQSDDASAAPNMAESPVETDLADTTEVRLHWQLADVKTNVSSMKLHSKVR